MPEVVAAMDTAFPEFLKLYVRAPIYAGLAMHFLQAEDFPLLTTLVIQVGTFILFFDFLL